MRTLVISNASRSLLDGHIVGQAVAVQRQLADKSWEVLVDDDFAFGIDCLSDDPDVAFRLLCKVERDPNACPRCGSEVDVDWCWTCKGFAW